MPEPISGVDWTEGAAAELVTRYLNGMLPDEQVPALNQCLVAHPPSREMFVRFARLHGMLTEHAITGQGAPPAQGWDPSADEAFQADLSALERPSLHDATVQTAIREIATAATTARSADELESLRLVISSETAQPPVDVPHVPTLPTARPYSSGSRRMRIRWITGLAAVLALAVGVAVSYHAGSVAPGHRGAVAKGPEAVATLGSLVNADLRRLDGRLLVAGDEMPAEAVELRTGWARLDFKNGATVVVESPAHFRVDSAFNLDVTTGKVTADVPTPAHGFAVSAPNCRVVDLGTEFGVNVVSGAHTDVAVFRGAVTVNGAGGTPATLRQGQGWNSETSVVSTLPADVAASRFVRVDQFAHWTAAVTPAALPVDRVRAAEDQLCRDPSLSLYYSFGDLAVTPDRVVNRAASTAGRYDLPLNTPNAPTLAEGRLPGLSALDFDPAKQQRLLLADYPGTRTGQLTCAAWVLCRERSDWASIAKNWGATHGGAFHLGLDGADGELAAQLDGGTLDATGNPNVIRVNEDVDRQFPTDVWVHVVLTTDGHTANLYRDGQLVASAPSRPIAATQPTHALAIGFKADDNGVAPPVGTQVGYWNGRMGNLALWNRALSADEVQRLYASGLPGAADGSSANR